MTDRLDALRADLARHAGPARTRPLLELAQALADQYWRVGPGTPPAGPYLDEAIPLLQEAHGYLEQGELLRGQTACMLGWLHAVRHGTHGGPDRDREAAIPLLEEALSFPHLPTMLQGMARLFLAQMLLSRATRTMQSGEFVMHAAFSGVPAEEMANIDCALGHLRQVRDSPATTGELATATEAMLGMAETLQMLFSSMGGGPARMDLGRMMQAMQKMQDMQQRMSTQPQGTGFGVRPNIFSFDGQKLAMTPPLKRLVAVVDGPTPPAPPTPPRRQRHPEQAPTASADTLRRALLDQLPDALLPLLDDAAPTPDVAWVDELAAIAGPLVELPDATAHDQLLFALVLYLRDAVDTGGGWDDSSGSTAVADRLLSAADGLTREPADAMVLADRLATRLNVRNQFAQRFGAVVDALRTIHAGGLVFAAADRMILLSAETGRFEDVAAGLPDRILVAGDGPAPDGPMVSWVGSAQQVVELSRRARRAPTEAAVFVANPRGHRHEATMDALRLRRTFFSRSIGLGQLAENSDGPGTADEVRAHLDASLLHLGCEISPDGGLELAGSSVLDAHQIGAGAAATTGGVAVLPPTTTGAAALANALLAARFVAVIGFRAPVQDRLATLIYIVLYAYLVDERRDPASAVRAVHEWMADPNRKPPIPLPPGYDELAEAPELADREYSSLLIHYGV
jgi:hypothetical protein